MCFDPPTFGRRNFILIQSTLDALDIVGNDAVLLQQAQLVAGAVVEALMHSGKPQGLV